MKNLKLKKILKSIILEAMAREEVVSKKDNLNGADLKGLDLSGADLSKANLEGANLSGANLQGTNLSDANLKKANLSKAMLQGAKFRRAALTETNFTGAIFDKTTDLKTRQMFHADFRDAQMPEVDLITVPISAKFIRSNLEGAKFDKVETFESSFFAADLQGATFSGAKFNGPTVFRSANLKGAKFDGAQFEDVNFVDAELQGASFVGAKLGKAQFAGAMMQGANLLGTKGVKIDLAKAFFNNQTKLPLNNAGMPLNPLSLGMIPKEYQRPKAHSGPAYLELPKSEMEQFQTDKERNTARQKRGREQGEIERNQQAVRASKSMTITQDPATGQYSYQLGTEEAPMTQPPPEAAAKSSTKRPETGGGTAERAKRWNELADKFQPPYRAGQTRWDLTRAYSDPKYRGEGPVWMGHVEPPDPEKPWKVDEKLIKQVSRLLKKERRYKSKL